MSKALELAKFGRETPPTGVVVGDTDAQTLSSKTFSDGPVFSGLNANGVPFLNASKVLSSSGTFVFDGTNLGVGVASPAYRFDVQGSGAGIGVARFASNDTNTTTALAIFQRNGGAVSAAVKYNATNSPLTIDFGTTTSHALTFITADTERLRIGAGGVIQKPGTNGGFQLMDGNTAGGVKIGAYTANFLANGYLAFEGYAYEYGRFDSTGNFSIGTQSSDYRLTVARGNESTGQVGLANFRTEATGSATYNAGVQIFGTASATAANRLVSFVMDADGADAAGGNYFYITKTGGDGRVDLIQASNAPMGFAANYVSRGVIDMTLSAAGNLGLGTTPSTGAKFQVTGYTDFWNTTNTLLRVQHDGTHGKLQSYTGGGVGNIVLNPDGGNVGIGTTNPAATLHVNASGGGTIRASRSSFGGEYVQLDHDGTDGTLRVSGNNKLYLATNGSTRVTVTGAGKVGIGIPNPTEVLTISHSDYQALGIYRNLDYNSVGAMGVRMYFGGYVGTTATTSAAIDGTLMTATTGRLSFSTLIGGTLTEAVRIDTNGSVRIGGTFAAQSSTNEKLTVDGVSSQAATLSNSSDIYGTIYLKNRSTTAATIQPYLYFNDGSGANRGGFGVKYTDASVHQFAQGGINWYVGSSGFSGLAATLNATGLGIGTSPQTLLTLRTTHSAPTSTTYTGALLIHDEPNNVVPHLGMGVAYDGGGNYSWIQSNSSGGTYPLILQGVGGTVGIGTKTPWTKFQVTHSVNNTNTAATNFSDYQNAGIIIHNQDDAGTGSKAGLFFAFAGSPGILAGIDGYKEYGNWNTGLRFYTNNQTGGPSTGTLYQRMCILPNGNVGIGNSLPQVALDVVGNAQITTTAAGTYGLIAVGSSGGARDIFLAGQSGFSNGFTVRYDGASMVYAFQDGNVCIGATTPFGNFGVAGSTNLGNNVASTQAAQYFTRLSGYAPRYDASNRYGSYGQLIFHANDQWTSGARRWMITNVLGVTNFGIIRSVGANTDPIIGDGGSVSSGTVDFAISNTGRISMGATGVSNNQAKLEITGGSLVVNSKGGGNRFQELQMVSGHVQAGGSTVWTTFMYSGPTFVGNIRVIAVDNRGQSFGCASWVGVANICYGGGSGPLVTQTAALSGSISAVNVIYNNSGYILQAAVTYSGATSGVTIYFSFDGNGSDAMYAEA